MNKSGFKPGVSAEGPDKVDMSLDDIIRLNKKQKQGQKVAPRKQRPGITGRLAAGRRAGAPLHWGAGVNKPFRRRAQGVITGLAARKAALLKGVSPLNRPALNRANLNKHAASRAPTKRPVLSQRTRPFVSQRRHPFAQTQTQRRPYADVRRTPGHVSTNRPFRLRRKWNAPPGNEPQREARQATFLSRRGLKVVMCVSVAFGPRPRFHQGSRNSSKVHAHMQKTSPVQTAQRTQRSRPWRTPLNNSGILTVSIDNPGARTQPEPAHSWSLHPPTVTPPTQDTQAPEPERKTPKGVALQFDINSVGKQQTVMTLNERFRILKMKRMAAAQQNARGGRFVTVG